MKINIYIYMHQPHDNFMLYWLHCFDFSIFQEITSYFSMRQYLSIITIEWSISRYFSHHPICSGHYPVIHVDPRHLKLALHGWQAQGLHKLVRGQVAITIIVSRAEELLGRDLLPDFSRQYNSKAVILGWILDMSKKVLWQTYGKIIEH